MVKTHHWVSQQGPPEAGQQGSPPVGTWTSDNASMGLPGPPHSLAAATAPAPSAIANSRSDCKHGAVTPLPKRAHSHGCEFTQFCGSPLVSAAFSLYGNTTAYRCSSIAPSCKSLASFLHGPCKYTHTHRHAPSFSRVQNVCFSFLNVLLKYN